MPKTEKQKEANKVWMRKWAKDNPAKVLERRAKQYSRIRNDKDLWGKELNRHREYRVKNGERVRNTQRNSRANNLEKVRAYYRIYRKKDVLGQISTRLYSRINGALKAQDVRKCNKTIELVGCSIPELKYHLESKFQNGMSWENKKLFHIDHIIPLSQFDLTDPEQQKRAFNYRNLQPLWAFDNLSKGSKLL